MGRSIKRFAFGALSQWQQISCPYSLLFNGSNISGRLIPGMMAFSSAHKYFSLPDDLIYYKTITRKIKKHRLIFISLPENVLVLDTPLIFLNDYSKMRRLCITKK
jgi:hypothetical protein